MRKHRGHGVWPCLCGFNGTYNQIRRHQRKCETWKARDVAAVYRERRFQNPRPVKGERCEHCNVSPHRRHRVNCPRSRDELLRQPRFAPVEVWYAFLQALTARYEASGRGAKLMALFDKPPE